MKKTYCHYLIALLLLTSFFEIANASDKWDRYQIESVGVFYVPPDWEIDALEGVIYSITPAKEKWAFHIQEALSAHPNNGDNIGLDLFALWLTDVKQRFSHEDDFELLAQMLNANLRKHFDGANFILQKKDNIKKKKESIPVITYKISNDTPVELNIKYVFRIHKDKVAVLRIAYTPDLEVETSILVNNILKQWEVTPKANSSLWRRVLSALWGSMSGEMVRIFAVAVLVIIISALSALWNRKKNL